MKSDIKDLADSVYTAVTGYLGKALEPVQQAIQSIQEQVTTLYKHLENMPTPKDGDPGQDGTSVTLEDVEPLIIDVVAKAVALIPLPEPGKDGTSVTAAELQPIIAELVADAVAALPPPQDGKDGTSVAIEDVQLMVAEQVNRAVSEIPPAKDGEDGKDGESVDPDSVEDFLDKAVDARVQAAVAQLPPARDGEDGKDGEPGRHALQIDILPSINPEASYARGTFASYRGGLIHALRATDAVTDSLEKAGWEIVVEGYPLFEVRQDDEDPRLFVMRAIRTNGRETTERFRIPAVIDAGFYQPEKEYRQGDGTTFGGSFWIAQKDTATKPCIGNEDWRLSVRKGRDGKRAS